MRILVHDYSGHPFQAQLSRQLAGRGHDVLHLHCESYTTGKGNLQRQEGDPPGFSVLGLDLGQEFEKYSAPKRVQQEVHYGLLSAKAAKEFGPHVVVSSNVPLLAQLVFQTKVQRTGAGFVFWQQDVYSVAMTQIAKHRVPVAGAGLGWSFQRLERHLARASDAVVVISEDFRPVLRRWGVDEDHVSVIENWAPLDELEPLAKDNPWARQQGLADTMVLLYSGTLGIKHNPSLLLRLAEQLERRAEVVVVSEGPAAEWLVGESKARGVDNLRVLPFQPYAVLPEVLATADVLTAILEPDAGEFSVPSKVLTYLCAGRPLLCAIPHDNLAARIIQRESAGLVADPRDPSGFVAAAEKLVGSPELRSDMARQGRAYATSAFDISVVGDKFESVISWVHATR